MKRLAKTLKPISIEDARLMKLKKEAEHVSSWKYSSSYSKILLYLLNMLAFFKNKNVADDNALTEILFKKVFNLIKKAFFYIKEVIAVLCIKFTEAEIEEFNRLRREYRDSLSKNLQKSVNENSMQSQYLNLFLDEDSQHHINPMYKESQLADRAFEKEYLDKPEPCDKSKGEDLKDPMIQELMELEMEELEEEFSRKEQEQLRKKNKAKRKLNVEKEIEEIHIEESQPQHGRVLRDRKKHRIFNMDEEPIKKLKVDKVTSHVVAKKQKRISKRDDNDYDEKDVYDSFSDASSYVPEVKVQKTKKKIRKNFLGRTKVIPKARLEIENKRILDPTEAEEEAQVFKDLNQHLEGLKKSHKW